MPLVLHQLAFADSGAWPHTYLQRSLIGHSVLEGCQVITVIILFHSIPHSAPCTEHSIFLHVHTNVSVG